MTDRILATKEVTMDDLNLTFEVEDTGMLNVLVDGKRVGQVRVVPPVEPPSAFE